MQGLASRPDADEALQKMPVAAIPGGSGNGLSQSVMFESGEEYSDIDAMFIAIKGKPVPMDLSRYVTSEYVHFATVCARFEVPNPALLLLVMTVWPFPVESTAYPSCRWAGV